MWLRHQFIPSTHSAGSGPRGLDVRKRRTESAVSAIWATALLSAIMLGCGGSHSAAEDAGVGIDGGAPVDRDGDIEVAIDAGRAMDDAGLPETCDMPGTIESLPCGRCGTVERFCTAAGTWAYGECSGEAGECAPGTVDTRSCGMCGRETARCSATCTWESSGECTGEGTCVPGSITRSSEGCSMGQTRELTCTEACTYEPSSSCTMDACATPGSLERVPCGSMCGTVERFCNASRVWEYGTCEGAGVCVPGTTRNDTCGMCGEQRMLCTDRCAWITSGTCTAEGTCVPGTTTRTSAGCPPQQTRLMRCDDECAYTTMVEPCARTREVDVTFLIDATGSNEDSLVNDLPIIESRCIAPLLALNGVAVGVSYAGAFPVESSMPPFSLANPDDRPFEGGIEPTSSAAGISAEIAGRRRFNGGDAEDSLVEALSTLSGGAVHPESLALACTSGRVAGGCWRAGAERVIVAHTDSLIHNGPDPDGSGLLAPYMGIMPAPAEWPAVRASMMSSRTALIWFDSGVESPAQFLEMLSDLGQPESDHHQTTNTSEIGAACDALVTRVRALAGL